MDLHKNIIPKDVEKIHLTAICGTGMGALAAMLKDKGFHVTGSDNKIYPPMSTFLKNKGISIADGFKPDNILYGPDVVVVGNAVSKDNSEAQWIRSAGLNYCSMPQAINRFAGAGKKTLLVAGTHGKTTTSSILAWILHVAGLAPSFMIGGILKNFNSNYKIGDGEYIVIEGDEYDTAFFDKGPKFLHYEPFMAVLTSVEFDHADIYDDLQHIKLSFSALADKMQKNSILFSYDNDENIKSIIKKNKEQIFKSRCYGKKADSYIRLGKVLIKPPWSEFEVFVENRLFYTFKTRLIGEHNLINALASIGIAKSLDISAPKIASGLETFLGVKRRQEIKGVRNGITVIDDFAHHPTAVKQTIRAVRPYYPKGRLIAVFEPRTNSSMHNVFQNAYVSSFDSADIICIRKSPRLKKIPKNKRLSCEKLVYDLKKRKKKAYYFSNIDSIVDLVFQKTKSGDIVLVMSNGWFDNICEKLLKRLNA